MQERCMTFRFQKMGVIGQLYTDSLKVMVMKLQILNYMPMHVMYECMDIQGLKVVADLA